MYSDEELFGVPVLVLGASKSGLAASRLLKSLGADVYVSELRPAEKIPEAIEKMEELGVTYEVGGHTLKGFPAPQFAVVSPGIPTNAPIVQAMTNRGRPVFSEIEVASWFFYGTLIAVTGSNGKTTVTSWIEHTLQDAGLNAKAAGNIGYPFCDMILDYPRTTHAVVEVSSYQLESITTFRPHVSVLTNITPDHLERHGSLKEYAKAKSRIWINQDVNDWAILPGGDELIASISTSIRPQKVHVRMDKCPIGGAGLEGESIYLDMIKDRENIININELPIKGNHNVANAIATAAACRVLQLKPSEISKGLKSFHGVPHRLEVVGQNGRIWINDSKATNVDSLRVALEAVNGKIWLIAGGEDKGATYEPLRSLINEKVEKMLLIGSGAQRLFDELGDLTQVEMCETLENAVNKAALEAEIGITVLLSPGCASFDQFENFEDRGDRFRELVREVVRK